MTLKRHLAIAGALGLTIGVLLSCALTYITRRENPQGEFFDYDTGVPTIDLWTLLLAAMAESLVVVAAIYFALLLAWRGVSALLGASR
jgi:hypothetical protein